MSGLDVRLTGFAELSARLNQLAAVEATKAGQSAVASGATLLKTHVLNAAPRSDVPEGSVGRRKRKDGSYRLEPHAKISNHVRTKKVRDEAGKVTSAVYVDKRAYHASFVEYGSIHNAPNPFMLFAAQQHAQEVIEQMAKALNRQLIKRGV